MHITNTALFLRLASLGGGPQAHVHMKGMIDWLVHKSLVEENELPFTHMESVGEGPDRVYCHRCLWDLLPSGISGFSLCAILPMSHKGICVHAWIS